MNRAVFLDRDGVINVKAAEGEYVTRWEDFHFLPGVREATAKLSKKGWKVIVITNQRCIARGLLSVSKLDEIHEKMTKELALSGAQLDAIYYCPHNSQPACTCRKPLPGMLLRAALDHQIDLAGSWMVGDSIKDVEAGKRAGCRTILITNGFSAQVGNADFSTISLLGASEHILESAGDKARQ
jgi:D-glycero-D-manno-heptose 1,7-bisphosphate phosphatase